MTNGTATATVMLVMVAALFIVAAATKKDPPPPPVRTYDCARVDGGGRCSERDGGATIAL